MEPKTVTREALYEQVWETPMRTLAKSYGVSDVALAKACRKLNVPGPVRGYWAKVAAGHRSQKRPLPPTSKHQFATIKPPRRKHPPEPEALLPQPATVARIGTIAVPESVERAHPLTVKTRRHFADLKRRLERHAKRRPDAPYVSGDWPPRDDHGRFHCNGSEGFPLTASFNVLDRALRLLDTLAKELTKRGFRFELIESEDRYGRQQPAELRVTKDAERLSLRLREGYRRRELSAKELVAERKANQYASKYETLANGNLTFELGEQEYRVNQTFRDDKKIRLEDQLGRIVAAFVDAVPQQKELRVAREQAERDTREAEHRRWLELERIREEKQFVEELLSEAERARKFELLRDYLDRLERTTLRTSDLSDDGRSWLDRARRLIDTYDPARARLGRSDPSSEDDLDADFDASP